jgi:histidine decarboxylase
MIRSREDGSIDLEDLRESLRLHRDVPPILFANIGTTMKEGIDRIGAIRDILAELAIPRHYLHADAALAGMTLPFQQGAPGFDFAEGIDSIAISGHKFIGSPVPCGIVLARRSHVRRIARAIEYVGTLDTTIPGSRNGFTPLVLWHAIQRWGREGFARRVERCLGHAAYAVHRLRDAGIPAWRNPHAITVVFPRPGAELLQKWQIAVHGNIGHLLVMPQITRRQIDALAADLARDRAGTPGEPIESVAESS